MYLFLYYLTRKFPPTPPIWTTLKIVFPKHCWMFRIKALQAIIFYYSIHNFLFIFPSRYFPDYLHFCLFRHVCLHKLFLLEFFMMGKSLDFNVKIIHGNWIENISITKKIIQWIIFFFVFATSLNLILFYYQEQEIIIRRDFHFDSFLRELWRHPCKLEIRTKLLRN
jgi:hypothetical protein